MMVGRFLLKGVPNVLLVGIQQLNHISLLIIFSCHMLLQWQDTVISIRYVLLLNISLSLSRDDYYLISHRIPLDTVLEVLC